jgi:hypothetical protein
MWIFLVLTRWKMTLHLQLERMCSPRAAAIAAAAVQVERQDRGVELFRPQVLNSALCRAGCTPAPYTMPAPADAAVTAARTRSLRPLFRADFEFHECWLNRARDQAPAVES